jgi:hypothetical protein
LRQALAAAQTGDLIKVAQSTCRPDESPTSLTGTGSRTATFTVSKELILQGGYKGGGGSDADTLDPVAFPTYLSGDLEGNDDYQDPDNFFDPGLTDDNSYHVVTIDGSLHAIGTDTVIAGFIIRSGNTLPLTSGPSCGSQNSPGPGGAGLMCISASPTIHSCVFTFNHGRFGGGVFLFCNCNPLICYCTFDTNLADHQGFGNGGGLYMFYNCSPTVLSCSFIGNKAVHIGGGAAFQELCVPQFTQCIFSGNWAGDYGGGMRLGFDCSATIRFCTFHGNSCDDAGGGFSANRDNPPDDGDVVIRSCIFWNNSAPNGPQLYRQDDPGGFYHGLLLRRPRRRRRLGRRGRVHVGRGQL